MAASSSTTTATEPAAPSRRARPAARLLADDDAARRWLALATVTGAVAALALLGALALLARAVGDAFDHGDPLNALAPALVAVGALAVLRGAAIAVSVGAGQRAGSALVGSTRARLVDHVARLGPAGTLPEPAGEVVALGTEAVDELDPWAARYLPARRLAVIVPLVVAAAVVLVDPWTTLVLAFAGPLLVLLLALIGMRTRTKTEQRLAEMTWLRGVFLDVLQGLATLKAFGRAQDEADTIEALSRRHGETTMAVLVTAFQTSLVMEWAAVAATALVAVEVAFRMVGGDLAFAPALTVLVLTPEFFAPLRRLAVEYHAGSAGTATAERVLAVLATPAPMGGGATAGHRSGARPDPAPSPGAAPAPAGLVLSGVRARYPGSATDALADVSLTVAPGELVAVVGPSGAGKSTLARVILGFLAPEEGSVRIGDLDASTVPPERWRQQVAWVPQRPHLFSGTVAENVALGAPDADPAALRAAAEGAGAADLIDALPQGWATELGERGARLSGGQRQRLAIARALLVDRPVVVADEPTAHLDEEAEDVVLAALRRLAAGRSTLVIAHRPRTIALADRVVHLDRGRVTSAAGAT